MANPPRRFTAEELRAFRQAQIKKAREARAIKVKARQSPRCHPDRPQVEKTGLCHECYVGSTPAAPAKQIDITDVVKIAAKLDTASAKVLKEAALSLMHDRLPEYAQLHFEATKMAALKGDAKPAEWALTMIKQAGGTAVLEPPQKVAAEGGVRVFVGVQLGGLSQPADQGQIVEAEAVGK